MENPIPKQLYFPILSVVALLASIYSYLTIVFNDDIHIYFGVAKIVETFGTFPLNIDFAYESRPIGNRIIFYGLYKLFESVAGNEFVFQVATKSVVAAVILLVSYFFARMVAQQSAHAWAKNTVFVITALSLFTIHTMCIMQTEFFAVILSFLAIALMLHQDRLLNWLAGFVMVWIFLLKAVTLVMIPVIFAAWWLLTPEHKRWQMYHALLGLVVASVAILVPCIFFLRYFVKDFLALFPVQQAIAPNLISQTVAIFMHSLGVIWFMPVVAIGAITGIFVLAGYLQDKKHVYALIFAVMWGSLILVEYIQAEYWVYHYLGFIVPAVVSIYLFISEFYPDNAEFIGILVILAMLFVFGVSCSVWSTGYTHMWDKLESDGKAINEKFHLDQSISVLYLDQGNSVYYLKAPSYCRYIAPLSIQRSKNGRNLTGTQVYKDTMACVLRYDGRYVVMNRGWFGDHAEIDQKLAKEYTPVWNESWQIYQRKAGV